MKKNLLSLGLAALFAAGVAQAQAPRVDLALCIDSSGSINAADWQLQLNGTAAAIEDAATVPRDGSVRISVFQFSTTIRQEVAPTVITAANATSVANTIRGIAQFGDTTNIGGCITAARNAINGATPASTERQIIDISTDGEPNIGAAGEFDLAAGAAHVRSATNAARAAGIDAMNAIAVGNFNSALLEEVVFPQPANDNDGFLVRVANFAEYEAAIKRKIRLEAVGPGPGPVGPAPTGPAPVPANNPLALGLLAGLLALVGVMGFRRRG
jgi:hypothetical protein